MNLDECFRKGLLKRVEFPNEVVDKEIHNARRHIDNAEFCKKGKKYDLAVVSIYTAMFHAARALMFRDGIKERSHVCVIIYLKEKYPEFDDYANILDSYRRSRHTMLYGIDVEAMEDDALFGIDSAKEFINKIENVIKN